MTQYDNRNSGILAKNDRKSQDNHPDITGSINVDGVDYFLNGWHRRRKDDGRPFYSMSVKRKEKQADTPQRQDGGGTRGRPSADLDDDIPFQAEVR